VDSGTYTVGWSFAGNGNYNSATGTSTITVNEALLRVAVTSDLMLLGSTPPPLTGTVNGNPFTGGTTFTTMQGDTLTITLSSSVSSASPVGVYGITASVTGPAIANYLPVAPGQMYVVTVGPDTTGSGSRNVNFWDNSRNSMLISTADLLTEDRLNLVNANGSAFDPSAAAQLQSWLKGANGKNAAYLLSVELATTDLNVVGGVVKASDIIYAGNLLQFAGTAFSVAGLDGGGFISIGNLMTLANNALAQYPVSVGGDASRQYLLALTQTLQAADANADFVQQPVPPGI
jgi:hypothetical protein